MPPSAVENARAIISGAFAAEIDPGGPFDQAAECPRRVDLLHSVTVQLGRLDLTNQHDEGDGFLGSAVKAKR